MIVSFRENSRLRFIAPGNSLWVTVATFGENLKRLMKARKVKGTTLASQIGVKQSVLSGWRNDRKGLPETPTLLKLANALGCSFDELLRGVDVEYERRQQRTWREFEDKLAAVDAYFTTTVDRLLSTGTAPADDPVEIERIKNELVSASADLFAALRTDAGSSSSEQSQEQQKAALCIAVPKPLAGTAGTARESAGDPAAGARGASEATMTDDAYTATAKYARAILGDDPAMQMKWHERMVAVTHEMARARIQATGSDPSG